MPHAALSDTEFRQFQQMMLDVAGIHLSEAKKPLVSGRLARRLGQQGLESYGDYYRLLARERAEMQVAVDLLTTNETHFFREPRHFDFLRQRIAPTLLDRPGVRLWCGACSSGEEPYTIAMVLAETLGGRAWEVVASDISTRVLETARSGLYPMEDAENIPKAMLARYCLKGVGAQAGSFLIDQPLRERVRFRQVNLNAPLPEMGMFDVIFLRNVMIYFNIDTKREVLKRLLPVLRPGGWFIVSHSESLNGVTDALTAVQPSIYRKPDA